MCFYPTRRYAGQDRLLMVQLFNEQCALNFALASNTHVGFKNYYFQSFLKHHINLNSRDDVAILHDYDVLCLLSSHHTLWPDLLHNQTLCGPPQHLLCLQT